jgi:hypothetical protein
MSNTIDLVPNCANCRFSKMASPEQGTCNRYAPRPSHATQGEVWAEWPLVMPHDWCGEWALLPAAGDELLADYLARNPDSLPNLESIAVLTTPSSPEPATRFPHFLSYDEPYSDPLR